MEQMKTFMAYHYDPDVDCSVVQANWRKLAAVEKAKWIKTYYSEAKGMRYCVWRAPDEETLKHIFTDMNVSWETIVAVEETTPDMWGEEKWLEHLAAEETADNIT
jgi:hypothetical protein